MGPRDGLWGRHGPCMVKLLASLQVGLAVQYGPPCKGHKHGPSQGPLLLLPCWNTCLARSARRTELPDPELPAVLAPP